MHREHAEQQAAVHDKLDEIHRGVVPPATKENDAA
jgi:hypothetical protein